MKVIIRAFLASVIIALVVAGSWSKCFAADSLNAETNHQWWVDMGLGLGTFHTRFAIASNISFSFQTAPSQFTFRFNHVSGLPNTLFGPASDMSEWGLLYGRVLKINASYASVSGGLGYTVESSIGRSEIPLEAGLYAGVLQWIGIGLKACANISPGIHPNRFYWTLGVGLLVGKLR